MFNQQASLVFKQDGFMFTPENVPYNPRSNQYPLYRRVLTQYPDICKWKPKEKLTIDFLIRMGSESTLLLYTINNDREEEFKGSTLNPYDRSMVDSKNPMTNNLPDGSIVEYGFDFEHKMLIPHRVRVDKIRPNNTFIAIDVWDDIHRPIDETTLTGESFALVFAYHNNIKRVLYNAVPGKTLLDIGSGRGGDVSKWKKFSQIIAVEPNADHIEELKRRIDLQGMTDRVTIVQAGGEDTEKIRAVVRGQVDCISLMLSLSFFWQSADMVQALARTISQNLKPDGYIIFLTIDGDSLKQVFNPAITYADTAVTTQTRLELGPATIEYRGAPPAPVHINIKGTIVSEQDEWPVHIYDLLLFLGSDFTLIEHHRAESEKFLSPQESLYTQMYSSGVIRRSSASVAPPLPSTLQESITITRSPDVPTPAEFIQPPLATVTSLPVPPVPPPAPPPAPPIGRPLTPSSAPRVETKRPEVKELPPELGSMHVIDPRRPDTPGIGEDEVQQIIVPWYTDFPIYRMATIGDGSCFFHAVLKTFYGPYQENKSWDFRTSLARKFRRDLAWLLGQPNPYDPENKTYRETTPAFVTGYEAQLLGIPLPIDYSLAGLQRLFNSSSWVGDEAYAYVGESLNINLYVLKARVNYLQPLYRPDNPDPSRPSVVVTGNDRHFEVIGILIPTGLQTVFTTDHPFISAIRRLAR